MRYRRGLQRPARQRKLSLALVASLGLLATQSVVPHVAMGQTPSEIATAKAWFAEGLAREEKGDYRGALELFRRAVQVKRTPQIAYHVALGESRTGALVEAMLDLDNVATLARAANAENVVVAAQAELMEVKKRVPTLLVRSPGPDAPTKLIVDGSPIALAVLGTAMPVDPGEHTVTVEYASGARGTKKATLVERDTKTLEIAPEGVAILPVPLPLPTPPPSPLQTEPQPLLAEPTPAHSSGKTWPWVAVGVGSALFVGGAALFADAWVKQGNLHDQCPSRTECNPSLQGSYSTAKTLDGAGIGLGVAGIAVAGLGVTLLAIHPSASTTGWLEVSPRGATGVLRF